MNIKNVLITGSRERLIVGLLSVFAMIVVFYIFLSWLLPEIATASTIALVGCLVIYFQFRWRINIPDYYPHLRELRALSILSPLLRDTFLLYSTDWALEPETLCEILIYIQTHNCKTVVECGSGVSTVAIGNLLKHHERGHLYVLEDDEHWHSLVSEILAKQNLNEYVTLIYAPLRPYLSSDSDMIWYDADSVQLALKKTSNIDVLLVDGPETIDDFSRAPALSFFWSWLDESSLIVLDDAKRVEEQAVLAKWQQEFNISVDINKWTRRGQAFIRINK